MAKGRAADLIVLDLDNTLFDEGRIVSPGNRAAIQKAQDAGVAVSICRRACIRRRFLRPPRPVSTRHSRSATAAISTTAGRYRTSAA